MLSFLFGTEKFFFLYIFSLKCEVLQLSCSLQAKYGLTWLVLLITSEKDKLAIFISRGIDNGVV